MLWPAYFILAYVVLGLQIGLRAHLMIGGAWPNLVLLAVVFIAVNAPRDAALLGAFGLGLLQDMTSGQPLGLYAFSYGLVAMFTVSTQQLVYRGHPLTHFSLALVGGLASGFLAVMQSLIRGGGVSPTQQFYVAVYTAAAAPLVLGGLNRIKRAFLFQPSRRKMRL